MAKNFKFTGQRLTHGLVSSISDLLNAAKIPNLLWGNYLLCTYGVPTIVDGVDFVVPDEQIDKSDSILSKADFLPCSRPSKCPHATARFSPRPYAHLHIDDEFAVSLHRQSDVLVEIPDLKSACDDSSSDTMYASDPRLPSYVIGRGEGRWDIPTSVRIPSVLRYCETLIYMNCRDYNTDLDSYWGAMLTYMMEFVDGTEIFDGADLRDGYREFYFAMKEGDWEVMWMLLEELRQDLMLQDEEPPIPTEFTDTVQTIAV
ncbi:uncharacterized protein BDV17DRAFT_81009 [Aspergillus undulatus]|uniref:uncharacterized protein n=1 Tax=Aspergillus undulatus TaxID=1810928 RepID=UPI003CCD8D74